MTSIAIDGIDLMNVVTQINDRQSLLILNRILESEITVSQARLNQLQQVQGAIQEQMKGTAQQP